ncbi:hypothetical protein PZB21_25680 [Rhizobium sp. CBK13]|uniref:hypothetical protein n=1 Tax=Rhizobium sp. CBK13 TaxID=3031399 RepID=UPI0023B120F7|nr:hypothetical protein [Rhizobium sp. CBK13]MDE8762567.1 hypothetical protein [Rhizobium sp. CBK13]
MHTSEDVIADMPDGYFWFRQQSLESSEKKSIVSVTFGNTDALNRVKDVPLPAATTDALKYRDGVSFFGETALRHSADGHSIIVRTKKDCPRETLKWNWQ